MSNQPASQQQVQVNNHSKEFDMQSMEAALLEEVRNHVEDYSEFKRIHLQTKAIAIDNDADKNGMHASTSCNHYE